MSMMDGAVRWAAPELYYTPDSHEEGESHALSEHSDIYSYGSVMLQVSPIFHLQVVEYRYNSLRRYPVEFRIT